MEYHHTQKGPVSVALIVIAVALGVNAWLFGDSGFLAAVMLGAAALFLFLALSFHQLTVKDQGEYLALKYGPLPAFGKRIPYASMTAVEPGRTSLIDGFGIHYVPGRGWTYNLWGAECAVIRLGDRILRVGSDDVANLVSFLRRKIQGLR